MNGNFPLLELPPELIIEILNQAAPHDVINALATGSTFRTLYLPEQLGRLQSYREQRRLARIREAIIARSLRVSQNNIVAWGQNRTHAVYLASLELTDLLGPNFPHYQNRALVSLGLLLKWFNLYALLNDLQTPTEFTLDPTLATLLNLPEGTVLTPEQLEEHLVQNHLFDVYGNRIQPRHLTQRPPAGQVPLGKADKQRLAFISAYLDEITMRLVNARNMLGLLQDFRALNILTASGYVTP